MAQFYLPSLRTGKPYTIEEFNPNEWWDSAISWSQNGLDISLLRQKDNLLRINVLPTRAEISNGQILECIGSQPEWYRAIYGPRMERSGADYIFEIWLPAKGIIIRVLGSVSSLENLPVLSQNTIITDFLYEFNKSGQRLQPPVG